MSVDASAVARVVGITTTFKDLRAGNILFLPQRIAILAQGETDTVYSTEKYTITSAKQAGDRYGYGSPAHLVARELFPKNGDGVGTIPVTVYPLEHGYEGTTASGTITPSGTQTAASTYYVRVGGILSQAFSVAASATVAERCDSVVAAINGVLEMPVVATDNTTAVGLESKWPGVSANGIEIEVIGESLGTTWTIVQPTGGTVNPTLADALDQVGDVWETLFINTLDAADTSALDELQEFGEGRWGTLVKKPCVAFYGNTATSVSSATSVTSTRTDDRVNCQLVAPGSTSLPFLVAARQVARIAKVANENPPRDYGSQRATGLVPGDDGDQWDYAARDQAVKAGSSTVQIKSGVVCLSDIVTPYAPDGEEPPAYRFVCDIVKLQNIIYNTNLLFENEEWDGAPLIPDDQPTVNPAARKPSSAKAQIAGMIDSLGENAIISDPKTAKTSIVCEINSQNPKRLDAEFTVQLSGNANIISVPLNFGFFFG
jgi:phage tail sheath gpL-like